MAFEKKRTVTEVYKYTYREQSTTQLSIGSNANVGNLFFDLYDINKKSAGYIMFNSSYRSISDVNYQNFQCGIFLNNNEDLLSIDYCEVTPSTNISYPGTETLANAIYATGKYQGKNVTVNIKYFNNNKRTVTITYEE
jgi:hypothetical protein